MAYYIDLSTISLDSYKAKLETAYTIPSRTILKERLDERFEYFKSMGINNVLQLRQTLSKKEKFAQLAKVECFAGNYLVILLRELNSIHPKPVKLKELAEIASETVLKLEQHGIKDTLALYEKVKTPAQRTALSQKLNIPESELLHLTKLTDLSRIKWVGATFARMLLDVGIDSAEKASKTDYVELHQKIMEINKEKNFYKGQIGLHDIKLCVEAAKELSFEIQY